MAVKKPIYKSKRGEEFASAAEAAAADRVDAAGKEFNDAAEKLRKAIGSTAKLADGSLLDVSTSDNYWWLRSGFNSPPRLARAWMWPHNAEFDVESGRVVYRYFDSDRREYVSIPIDQLYRDKRAADAAFVAAVREWLVEQQENLAAIEKGVSDGR